MEDIRSILKEVGARNGLEIALDENGACTLELEDGRVMLLQERADLNELDFVATLWPVPVASIPSPSALAAASTANSTAAAPTT